MAKRIDLLASEIRRSLSFDQPNLNLTVESNNVVIRGLFDLKPNADSLVRSGRLDQFEVSVLLREGFPKTEPIVYETSGRIPRVSVRHINGDGSCCFGVWEAWSSQQSEVTFERFLNGPLRDFFFGQHYFEQFNKWPFGEYKHGKDGILESYGEVLNCKPRAKEIGYLLRLFSKSWPRGHWPCPCGSHKRLRYCCIDAFREPPVSPRAARQMQKRFLIYFE